MAITLLYQFGLFAAVVLVLATITSKIHWMPLAAGAGIIVADVIATIYADSIIPQPLANLHWNWVGKFASIAMSTGILALFPSIRARCGLVLRQRARTIGVSIGLLAALGVLAIVLDRGTPLVKFSAETLLYQAVMPTVSEELIYRGSLLVLLNMALPGLVGAGRFSVSAGTLATCAIFGIGHGVASDGFKLVFSNEALIWTSIIGVVLTVLRSRSGSLVFPMFGHSLFNLISEGLPMFVAI